MSRHRFFIQMQLWVLAISGVVTYMLAPHTSHNWLQVFAVLNFIQVAFWNIVYDLLTHIGVTHD